MEGTRVLDLPGGPSGGWRDHGGHEPPHQHAEQEWLLQPPTMSSSSGMIPDRPRTLAPRRGCSTISHAPYMAAWSCMYATKQLNQCHPPPQTPSTDRRASQVAISKFWTLLKDFADCAQLAVSDTPRGHPFFQVRHGWMCLPPVPPTPPPGGPRLIAAAKTTTPASRQ